MVCTDKCPAFSGSEALCTQAGFCMWNSKYRVCFAEVQDTFTEITVSEKEQVQAVVAELEKQGVVVVVVDEERSVIMVYGEEEAVESVRKLVADEAFQEEHGIVGVNDIEVHKQVMSKGAFVGMTVAGGVAIVGLAGGVAAMALKLFVKQAHSMNHV